MPSRTGKLYLSFVPIRRRQQFAAALLAMIPALSGCMSHIRIVPKTRPADIVMSTSLEQLIKQINTQYDAIQTMQASVGIVATTGGGLIGEEKISTSLSGYIFLRKPDSLRVILRVPVVGSTGSRHGQRRLQMATLGPSQKNRQRRDLQLRGMKGKGPLQPAPRRPLRLTAGARTLSQ